MAPITPSFYDALDWLTTQEISSSQKKQNSRKMKNTKHIDNLIGLIEKRAWVPEQDNLQQLHLLVAAHTGSAGTDY